MLSNSEISKFLGVPEIDFCGSDLAAFTHLRPVLLAVGYYIHNEQYEKEKTYVQRKGYAHWTTDFVGTYAYACCMAIAHLAQHEPETLARAVKEVRG